MQVCIRDETPTGQSLHELSLEFLSERVTVRELIRERVHHEVKELNRLEHRLKDDRPIDWEAQFERALDGFANNGFFILIDDKQVDSLDQEFVIGPATNVSFVRLVPLVGG